MPLIDRESRSSSTACISLGIVPLDLLLAASGPGLPTLPAHQGTVPQSELPSGGCANRLAFGQGNQDVVRAPLSSHPGINNTTSSWKSVQWVGGERSSCNLSYLLSYLIHSPSFMRDKQAEANWGYPVLQKQTGAQQPRVFSKLLLRQLKCTWHLLIFQVPTSLQSNAHQTTTVRKRWYTFCFS